MTQVSRLMLTTLRKEIDVALAPIAKKYDITLKAGNASFSPSTFTLKIDGAVVVNGVAVSKEATDFKNNAKLLGLAATDLDREFTTLYSKDTFKLTGAKISSPKYPILGTRVSDGKVFKFSSTGIRFK